MILSRKNSFVYIKGRKVGSTSIEMALSTTCGPDDIVTPISPPDEYARFKMGGRAQNFSGEPGLEANYRELVRTGQFDAALRCGVFSEKDGAFYNHMPLSAVERATEFSAADFTLIIAERNPYRKIISYANMALSFHQYDGRQMKNEPARIRAAIDPIFADGQFKLSRNVQLYKSPRRYRQTLLIRQESLERDLYRVFGILGLPWKFEALPQAKRGTHIEQQNVAAFFSRDQLDQINAFYAEEFELFGYPKL